MKLTVIDLKKQKSTICSFKKASCIIGVSSKTISRWYKLRINQENKIEEYNGFIIYFDTQIIKQNPRNKNMSS